MTIGERIKSARVAAKLTQGQLAAKVGATSGMTVSRWETARFGPGREWLEPLSEALGVTTDWLLTGAVPTKPESQVETVVFAPEIVARLSAMFNPPPTRAELEWAAKTPYCQWTVESLYQVIDGARRGMSAEQVAAMEAETALYAAKS
jgi:transcriptional regulator with XRE-family HTH domain